MKLSVARLTAPFIRKDHCYGLELLKDLFVFFGKSPDRSSLLWVLGTDDAGRIDMLGGPLVYAVAVADPNCFISTNLDTKALESYNQTINSLDRILNDIVSFGGATSVLIGFTSSEHPGLEKNSKEHLKNEEVFQVVSDMVASKGLTLSNFYAGITSQNWCDYVKLGFMETEFGL